MSEKLRQALAAGDHLAAAHAIFEAHRGDYDADAISGLHRVGRMSRAELRAPAPATDTPVDRDETVRVTTRVRLFGNLRR